MIYIWSGSGIVVPLIPIGCLIASIIVNKAIFGQNEPKEIATIVIPLVLLLSGWILYFLGKRFEAQGRTLVDPKTQQEVRIGGDDSFFFIRVKLWGIAIGFFGVLCAALFLVGSIS